MNCSFLPKLLQESIQRLSLVRLGNVDLSASVGRPPDDENPVKKQNVCVFDGVLNNIKFSYVFMNLSLQRKKNGLCEQDCQERSGHLSSCKCSHQRGASVDPLVEVFLVKYSIR